ncbi:MAG: hypothetical protein HQM11_00045 [SAR324 cluster bacterium]|nr:hypothetical protein [SAR324 cluster bacterium]
MKTFQHAATDPALDLAIQSIEQQWTLRYGYAWSPIWNPFVEYELETSDANTSFLEYRKQTFTFALLIVL